MSLNRTSKRRSDPTGQATRRRKATRSLNSRLKKSEIMIKRLVREIPSERRTVTPLPNQEITIVYDYQLTAFELDELQREIQNIINGQLETISATAPVQWFWSDQLDPPYRQGTLEELVRFNQLLQASIVSGVIADVFVQPVPIEQFLQSFEYQQELRKIVVKNYETITSLSNRTSAQVIQKINSGISAGLSPTDIGKDISERFDVSKANAKRIADTEINRAYNDAKLNATSVAEQRTGLKSAVAHISALLPTTRDSHADRHSKVFTVEDQRQWWDTGVNRINCKCSTTVVLTDSKGRVLQREDISQLEEERKFFEKEQFEFENE